jgi:hypothetical protein
LGDKNSSNNYVVNSIQGPKVSNERCIIYMNYNQKNEALTCWLIISMAIQNQNTCGTWIIRAKHNFNFMNVVSFFQLILF